VALQADQEKHRQAMTDRQQIKQWGGDLPPGRN
jgi:hypothetical protein